MASDHDKRETIEGAEAAQRFGSTLRHLVNVPRAELAKREVAYQKSRRAKKARSRRTSR